ncbi:hypothetical protein B0O80DRAFT_121473 [Mortierella sp. GBAus27b]|nr:hypothetical protein B0O80DRAFT_121473 [Mortierella sp. GBAus27b]
MTSCRHFFDLNEGLCILSPPHFSQKRGGRPILKVLDVEQCGGDGVSSLTKWVDMYCSPHNTPATKSNACTCCIFCIPPSTSSPHQPPLQVVVDHLNLQCSKDRLFRPPSTPPLPLPPTLPVEETICINGPSVPSAELKLTPHHSTSRYPCKSRPSGLSIPRHQLFLWVRVTRPDLSPHVFALTAILAQMNGSRSKGRKAKTTASLA